MFKCCFVAWLRGSAQKFAGCVFIQENGVLLNLLSLDFETCLSISCTYKKILSYDLTISLPLHPAPAWCPAPWQMLAKTSDISAFVPSGPLPLQCQKQSGDFLTSRHRSFGLQTTFWQMLQFIKSRQCKWLHTACSGERCMFCIRLNERANVSALVKKLNATSPMWVARW